jgi:uncharacterized membrane protein YbhN (UPF0104 family)
VKLDRYARPAAIVVLAAVTVYGVAQFVAGDWSMVSDYWREKAYLIPVVLLLATIDIALEGVGWLWIYRRFRLPLGIGEGAMAYLSSRAGMLLPAQLGRLIRPDAVARLGKGPLKECLKAEAVAFVLDAASVLALIAALLAYWVHPAAAPVAGVAVIVVFLMLGEWVAQRLLGTHLHLPPSLWWSWQTLAIVLIQLAGWMAHGLAFWVVVRNLPGKLGLWDALLFSAGSSVLGVGSGLPGGIGATELLLGVSLRFAEVPSDHWFVVVTAFRLITFWIWIPIGWMALGWILRHTKPVTEPAAAEGMNGQEAEIQ